jgi:hypothetical protein
MPAQGLALSCTHLRLPRRGHAADECQDAAAADPDRGRFAVADGATESAFAGPWAQLLVDGFVTTDGALDGLPWLPEARRRWAAAVRPTLEAPAVPWYLDAGLRQGAFATFLGLVVDDAGWEALAVGDSCLFQVRRESLVEAFPLGCAGDFGSTPWLLGARAEGHHAVRRRGDGQPGDRLWLMTDALAQWFWPRSRPAGGRGGRWSGRWRTARGPSPAGSRTSAACAACATTTWPWWP